MEAHRSVTQQGGEVEDDAAAAEARQCQHLWASVMPTGSRGAVSSGLPAKAPDVSIEIHSCRADTSPRTAPGTIRLSQLSSLKEPVMRTFLLATLLAWSAVSHAADLSEP